MHRETIFLRIHLMSPLSFLWSLNYQSWKLFSIVLRVRVFVIYLQQKSTFSKRAAADSDGFEKLFRNSKEFERKISSYKLKKMSCVRDFTLSKKLGLIVVKQYRHKIQTKKTRWYSSFCQCRSLSGPDTIESIVYKL